VIYGDGEKRRDFTYVDDIVDALKLILEKQSWGHIFELGRGKNYSINDIATMFNKPVVYKENKPGEAQETLCIDNTARNILGWEPKTDIKSYIQK
jgi:UDP-glucose 4-epimerase